MGGLGWRGWAGWHGLARVVLNPALFRHRPRNAVGIDLTLAGGVEIFRRILFITKFNQTWADSDFANTTPSCRLQPAFGRRIGYRLSGLRPAATHPGGPGRGVGPLPALRQGIVAA